MTTPLLKIMEQEYSAETIHQLVHVLNKQFPKKRTAVLKKIKKLNRLKQQPGFSIAILGTDGSGKSTLIKKITPTLKEAFHNKVYYEHSRPNKIPSLARLFGKKENFPDNPVTNPHGSSTSGFGGSLLRWYYYMIDYTIGYYLKVWPQKSIRSCVWIFDRYYYDYLIDPARSRIRLPKWLLKSGEYIIPKPDIILCLGTDATIIHHRKPELSLEEVERQITALKVFCKNHPQAKWIDTGKDINHSANEAMEYIIHFMNRRFEHINL